jgi:thiol-disulfide isomerase/thioredoxin
MKSIIIILFILSAFTSSAQVIIKINSATNKVYYLQAFTLNGYQKLDSAGVIGNQVTFPLSANTPPGMYMMGNGDEGFKFILNEPELKFETAGNALQDSLKVIQSEENKTFILYQQKRDKAYMQLDVLNQVLLYYDPSTQYYHTTLIEFITTQEEFTFWTDSILKMQPNAFVSHLIRADRKPTIPPGLNLAQQKEYFRNHWFDGIDWMDNTMMTSDVLTKKITDYLGLYSNPNFRKPELSQAFSVAVDKILPLAMQNPVIYEFTLKYLVRGFERYGFDDVILYIATNYSNSQQCENEQQSETLARLEKYKLLTVGKTAPDIQMKDMAGKELRISSVKSRKLLIFWASSCPHCKELLPEIVNWSQQNPTVNIKVIPISLDDDKTAIQLAVKELKIPWPILVDYKKWSSQAAIDYNIYATPTMLLLDGDNKILAKPMNLEELIQALAR